MRAEVGRALQPWVACGVLPLFAFVNAGVSLAGVTPATLLQTVPFGIAAGPLLGKATGVFAASCLIIRFGGASRPGGASYSQLFGVCVLCGSLVSAVIGAALLVWRAPRR